MFLYNALGLAWRLQLRWWLFLFKNPDFFLISVMWIITLAILLAASFNSSPLVNVLGMVEYTVFLSIAPALTVLYLRGKRSGAPTLIKRWNAALRGGWGGLPFVPAVMGALIIVMYFSGSGVTHTPGR
jgi:hypothetical protein